MPSDARARMAAMNLKTYRARTMADALAEVKRDLGRDAVILHTRTFRIGGWLGMGAKNVVEITASDSPLAMGPRPRRPAPSISIPDRLARAYQTPTPAPSRLPDAPRQAIEARREPESRIAIPPLEESPAHRAAAITALVPPSPALNVVGLDELASIKKLVTQVLQCSRQTAIQLAREAHGGAATSGGGGGGAFAGPPGTMPDPLFQHYLKLLESEVAAEIADELVAKVREELPALELSRPVSVRQAILKHLAGMIPTDDRTPAARRDARPLTIALVGPTGVGKTTTIAKLAATYKLREGKRVGLLTTDTYRIAAVEQLRTYAEIIGLPLRVVHSPTDMGDACAALADCDIILIDTAGRAPSDAGRLDELRALIDAARPHETHLVLSGAASQAVMLDAAARFASIRPNRVILTKLDEAVNLGILVNVMRRVSLRLSYVTNGQEVPDHIELGVASRLAERVLDAGAAQTREPSLVGTKAGGGA